MKTTCKRTLLIALAISQTPIIALANGPDPRGGYACSSFFAGKQALGKVAEKENLELEKKFQLGQQVAEQAVNMYLAEAERSQIGLSEARFLRDLTERYYKLHNRTAPDKKISLVGNQELVKIKSNLQSLGGKLRKLEPNYKPSFGERIKMSFLGNSSVKSIYEQISLEKGFLAQVSTQIERSNNLLKTETRNLEVEIAREVQAVKDHQGDLAFLEGMRYMFEEAANDIDIPEKIRDGIKRSLLTFANESIENTTGIIAILMQAAIANNMHLQNMEVTQRKSIQALYLLQQTFGALITQAMAAESTALRADIHELTVDLTNKALALTTAHTENAAEKMKRLTEASSFSLEKLQALIQATINAADEMDRAAENASKNAVRRNEQVQQLISTIEDRFQSNGSTMSAIKQLTAIADSTKNVEKVETVEAVKPAEAAPVGLSSWKPKSRQ